MLNHHCILLLTSQLFLLAPLLVRAQALDDDQVFIAWLAVAALVVILVLSCCVGIFYCLYENRASAAVAASSKQGEHRRSTKSKVEKLPEFSNDSADTGELKGKPVSVSGGRRNIQVVGLRNSSISKYLAPPQIHRKHSRYVSDHRSLSLWRNKVSDVMKRDVIHEATEHSGSIQKSLRTQTTIGSTRMTGLGDNSQAGSEKVKTDRESGRAVTTMSSAAMLVLQGALSSDSETPITEQKHTYPHSVPTLSLNAAVEEIPQENWKCNGKSSKSKISKDGAEEEIPHRNSTRKGKSSKTKILQDVVSLTCNSSKPSAKRLRASSSRNTGITDKSKKGINPKQSKKEDKSKGKRQTKLVL